MQASFNRMVEYVLAEHAERQKRQAAIDRIRKHWLESETEIETELDGAERENE